MTLAEVLAAAFAGMATALAIALYQSERRAAELRYRLGSEQLRLDATRLAWKAHEEMWLVYNNPPALLDIDGNEEYAQRRAAAESAFRDAAARARGEA